MSGDIRGSPVIIAYLAGLKSRLLIGCCIVLESTTGVGFVLNNDFDLLPYLVNPISSNASATGNIPESIYAEYIKIIPSDTIPVSELYIDSHIFFIFALYNPIWSGLNI